MKQRPILVIGDLHLGPANPAGTEAAAVSLLERHSGCEWVCLGDLFDLSADISQLSAEQAIITQLERFAPLTRALRRQLAANSAVTLVVGNHDAELGSAGARQHILAYLDLPSSAALSIEPWWIRRANLHLEHGHVWDPDNAPIHPLTATRHDNEPLGVALTRQVLAPTGAFQFSHAHQTTPLEGLIRALNELGWHAPEVILRYFVTGARIFWRAASGVHDATWRAGERAIDNYAREQGLLPAVIEQLTRSRPTPRHASAAATFARLYFDRALATVVGVASTAAAAVERSPNYLIVAAAGLLYLGFSRGDRARRYSASLVERVESAALGIRPIVEAKAVVFGHTHVVQARPGYVNTGAFGFPTGDGRPYLFVDEQQQLFRGWFGQTNTLEPLDQVVAMG
jgi:predicted phosphodiesterase